MLNLKDFTIPFSGLKLGEHSFDYQLGTAFFDLFDYRDFDSARLQARVDLLKKETSLELFFSIKGDISLPCDITNELFDMPIEDSLRLVVKFGEEYDDSREEVLILPKNEHQLNVAQYLYEMAVLAVPLKRVSPEVQRGEKGQEILARLREQHTRDEQEEIDPRWDKLKDLLN